MVRTQNLKMAHFFEAGRTNKIQIPYFTITLHSSSPVPIQKNQNTPSNNHNEI